MDEREAKKQQELTDVIVELQRLSPALTGVDRKLRQLHGKQGLTRYVYRGTIPTVKAGDRAVDDTV